MTYQVYILECADKTFYTGVTNDLVKRLMQHNTTSAGAKYTRSRRPVRLLYSERVSSLSAALRREAEIKRLTRLEKITLMRTHVDFKKSQ